MDGVKDAGCVSKVYLNALLIFCYVLVYRYYV
jgi:hypothetical protein